jgi:hypothetical protein
MGLGLAGRPLGIGAGAAFVALLLAAVALADNEQIKRTAAGNAEARAAVLTRADFGAATGWAGHRKSPDLNSAMPCGSFHPKQSDLVLIGAAEMDWTHAGSRWTARRKSSRQRTWCHSTGNGQLSPRRSCRASSEYS